MVISADIKMKNYKIKTSSVFPEGPMARTNNSGRNLMLLT